jgi:hypothetical protein
METTRVPCVLDYTIEETGLAGGSCLRKLSLDGAEDRVAAQTIQPSIALLIVRTILWRKMGSTSNEIECPQAGTPASCFALDGRSTMPPVPMLLEVSGTNRPVWAYLSIESLPVKLQMQYKAL